MQPFLAIFGGSIVLGYFGPGAGISAIGILLAVVAAVILGIVGFVWYPLRRLRRAMKRDNEGAAETPADVAQDSATAPDRGGSNT